MSKLQIFKIDSLLQILFLLSEPFVIKFFMTPTNEKGRNTFRRIRRSNMEKVPGSAVSKCSI